MTGGASRDALVKDVKQAFGDAAHIAVFVGGKRHDLAGNFGFLQSGQLYGVDAYGNQLSQPNIYTPGYDPNQNKTNFLDDVSVNGLGGLFASCPSRRRPVARISDMAAGRSFGPR